MSTNNQNENKLNSLPLLGVAVGVIAIGVIISAFSVADKNKANPEEIQTKMLSAANAEQYELAAYYRDQLKQVNKK